MTNSDAQKVVDNELLLDAWWQYKTKVKTKPSDFIMWRDGYIAGIRANPSPVAEEVKPVVLGTPEKEDFTCPHCGFVTVAGQHHSHPCDAESGHPDDDKPTPSQPAQDVVEVVARAIYGHKKDKDHAGADVEFDGLSKKRAEQFVNKARLALAAMPDHQAALARVKYLEDQRTELLLTVNSMALEAHADKNRIAQLEAKPADDAPQSAEGELSSLIRRTMDFYESADSLVRPIEDVIAEAITRAHQPTPSAPVIGLSEDEAVEIMMAGVRKELYGIPDRDVTIFNELRAAYRALLPHLTRGDGK